MILAGDIGGTKVNLGLFRREGADLRLVVDAAFPSRRYAGLAEVVREFLSTQGAPRVAAAAFGVAGPVRHGVGRLTNLPWLLHEVELAAELGLAPGRLRLLNDLEANAWGLRQLAAEDFVTLNPGDPGAEGHQAIIAAGTGLGEAGLFWDGHRHLPYPCEGGHATFGPMNALDAELFGYLHRRDGHVSWEKVLSGMGLVNIYEFLCATGRGEEPAGFAASLAGGDAAAAIARAAGEGTGTRCAQALAMMVRYYGAEAGNLALKLMATGGVFLGGGIAPKILPQLRQPEFMAGFLEHGPMRHLLAGIPVRVVLNAKTALLGAAHVAALPATATA